MIKGSYSYNIASITGTNYCLDGYLIMLVVRHLLTTTFMHKMLDTSYFVR